MPRTLEVEIELPDGTMGSIYIEERDDPAALARFFISERRISMIYLEPLTAFITNAMKRLTTAQPVTPRRTVATMNEASARLSSSQSHQQAHTTREVKSNSLSQWLTSTDLVEGSLSGNTEVFDRLYTSGLSKMKKRNTQSETMHTQSSVHRTLSIRPNSASERLYQQGLERTARVEKLYLQNQQLKEELPADCTFRPVILDRSKQLVTKDSVIQRLTVNTPIAQKERLSRLQRIAEEDRNRECTFQPSLASTRSKAVSAKAQYKIDISRHGTGTLDRLLETPNKKQAIYELSVPTDATIRTREAKRAYGSTSRIAYLM